jgi:hypothetical protein
MKLVIINKISGFMLQCSDSKGGCIQTNSENKGRPKQFDRYQNV